MELQQVTCKDNSNCCANFINGIEFLKRNMISQAAHSFEMAYEKVGYSDTHYNKYASFCGLTRVLLGDRGGLALCREVSRNETHDGDVFYNLARVEWHFKDRKRAVEALTNGIEIDEAHNGLWDFWGQIGMRKRKPITFLPRNNLLNNGLGRLFRKQVL